LQSAGAAEKKDAVFCVRTASSLIQAVGDVARPTSVGDLRSALDVAAYLYEIKYDGYRLRGVKAGDDVRLFTRGGHDWTARFASIGTALRELPAREVVIDGEVCVVDDAGHPSFQALQAWIAGEAHPEDRHTALAYVAFDLTWLDGRDLRDAKLEERRELLETLLQGSRPPMSFSRASAPTSFEELTSILTTVQAAGLEGLVAKRRGSTYVPGPSGIWRKLKFSQRQDCVIVGWVPMTGTRAQLGALIVAVVDGGTLRYAGRVGAGLDDRMRPRLLAAFVSLEVDKAPVEAPRIPGARWLRPHLVCEVEHTERLRDGSLRTPVLISLREDKTPEECTVDDEEPLAPAPRTPPATATPERVRLSNPTKVLFPRDGVTKQDVLAYYLAIAPALLPHLTARPITLQRWPDGIDGEAWYQHNAPHPLPAFVHFLSEEKKRRVIVDNVETLAWLVNLAALTLHVWSSRVPKLEQPDYTILDLDPGDGSWKDVIRVALAVRAVTDSLSLPTVVKTSGQRGLHVVVPLAPGPTHDDATAFAGRVAEAVAKALPGVATTERAKERRKGRLYIDYLINGRGKAIVAPYSIRALDGAPVSTPLMWSEVTEELDPRAFTIRTVPDRVAKHGDLFALALSGRGRI
jgi:bifunctional non-homologous end joining protein LigD